MQKTIGLDFVLKLTLLLSYKKLFYEKVRPTNTLEVTGDLAVSIPFLLETIRQLPLPSRDKSGSNNSASFLSASK